MTKLERLQASLPLISVLGPRPDYDMIDAPCHSFIRDGVLFISAEHGDGAADYYGDYRGGYPYIQPCLVDWAKAHGGHWEWQNPGCIGFYE